MGRVLRLLVVCLLAMALPLKGVASIAVGACAPAHHHAGDGASDHDHHHAAGVDPTADGADVDEHDAGEHGAGGHATPKCSACAPCCSAAAPGFVPSSIVEPDAARSSMADPVRVHAGVVIDVPHRPPQAASR